MPNEFHLCVREKVCKQQVVLVFISETKLVSTLLCLLDKVSFIDEVSLCQNMSNNLPCIA